tara:strand:- start:197 stop:667 length:471 start_codon:yes stop_codon:yes gene_type:complete
MHITCQNCNEPLSNDAKFCGGCGFEVQKVLVCLGCGENRDTEAQFCYKCGHSFEQQEVRTASQIDATNINIVGDSFAATGRVKSSVFSRIVVILYVAFNVFMAILVFSACSEIYREDSNGFEVIGGALGGFFFIVLWFMGAVIFGAITMIVTRFGR